MYILTPKGSVGNPILNRLLFPLLENCKSANITDEHEYDMVVSTPISSRTWRAYLRQRYSIASRIHQTGSYTSYSPDWSLSKETDPH